MSAIHHFLEDLIVREIDLVNVKILCLYHNGREALIKVFEGEVKDFFLLQELHDVDDESFLATFLTLDVLNVHDFFFVGGDFVNTVSNLLSEVEDGKKLAVVSDICAPDRWVLSHHSLSFLCS